MTKLFILDGKVPEIYEFSGNICHIEQIVPKYWTWQYFSQNPVKFLQKGQNLSHRLSSKPIRALALSFTTTIKLFYDYVFPIVGYK